MIKGNLTNRQIDYKDILSVVDEYDIYKYYLGYNFNLNHMYPSPFRSETKGSFNIFVAKGSLGLRHKDMGIGLSGNCFEFVKQLFNINFREALLKIVKDLNIDVNIKSNNSSNNNMKIILTNKILKEKCQIQFTTRKYNSEELKYWNEYHLDISDLKKYKVYPVEKLWINKHIMYNRGYIRFAYVFEDGSVKIYSPHDPDYKWITNTAIDYMPTIGLLDNSKSNICMVTKSYKCEMVISKIMENVTSVQNESKQSINPSNIKYLQDNFDMSIINFDPDKTGVENCTYYNQFGFGYWNIDRELLIRTNVKDASDYVKTFGPYALENLFKQRGYII